MSLLKVLGDEGVRDRVLDFLWWGDDVNSFVHLNKDSLAISRKDKSFGCSLFARLCAKMYNRDLKGRDEVTTFNEGDVNGYWPLLARRVPSWPTGIDVASFIQAPRNVKILPSKSHNSGDLCVVYGGRKKESHKGFTVVATDDHFPCLPGTFTQPRLKSEPPAKSWERLPLVELQKKKKEGAVTRVMAPFTRILTRLATEGNNNNNNNVSSSYKRVAHLSCVAYFEVDVHFNQGYRAMDDFRRFSVGLACSLFPLKKTQLGYDYHSFGYHRCGSLVHGNRRFARMPPYKPGDTIGCGLTYPPLSNGPYGKIFFTKNGDLVGLFDMGVESLVRYMLYLYISISLYLYIFVPLVSYSMQSGALDS